MSKKARKFFRNIEARVKVSTIVLLVIVAALSSMFVLIPDITVKAASTSDFSHYKSVTVDHAQVPSTQTGFPLLVHITDDSELFSAMQSDGDDIAFFDGTDGGSSQYPHEIEYWDWDTGNSDVTADIWVNVSSISSESDTVLYAFYGNATCADQEDMHSVWNSSYHAVWHLADNDTDTTVNESTKWTRSGDKLANAEPAQGTGMIGYGQTFDDTDDSINLTSAGYEKFGFLDGTQDFTIEMWFNQSEFDATSCYMLFRGDTNEPELFVRHNWEAPLNSMGVRTEQPSDSWGKRAWSGELATDTWYYWSVTYDSDTGYIAYINGTQVNTSSEHGTIDTHIPAPYSNIGNDGTGTYGINGTLDEIRISNVVRTADYLATTWNNLNNKTTFTTLGSEDETDSSSFSIAGLDDGDITWTISAGVAAWSNATDPGDTLLVITHVDPTDNCTDIYLNLTNLSYSGNWIDTSNITVVVSVDNNDSYDSTGYTLESVGCNFSFNDNWADLSDDANPFPIDGDAVWTNYTFMVRFYLNTNQETVGTYVNSTAWYASWRVES